MAGFIALAVIVLAMGVVGFAAVGRERRRRLVCLQCDGVGQHWQHYGSDNYDFDAVDCAACGGTGG